ncbi:MAG: hypothetical protein HYZ50_26745 [Deltaproteobacteria bacterium]|nr:hypothetical protein [Deltaproteobacteria bacterium]
MQRRMTVTVSRSSCQRLWLATNMLVLTMLLPAMTRAGDFLDISTRGFVGREDEGKVLIGGFIIEDSQMTVLIRAIGPSLSEFGVPGVLANPTVQLVAGTATIGFNDNWQEASNWPDIPEGLRPTNTSESAILITLPPGAYTAIVRGASNTTGIGLVEVIKINSTQAVPGAGLFEGATSQGNSCGPTSSWSGTQCAARLYINPAKTHLIESPLVDYIFVGSDAKICSSSGASIVFIGTCGNYVRILQSCSGLIPISSGHWELHDPAPEGNTDIVGNCSGNTCTGTLTMSIVLAGCSTGLVSWTANATGQASLVVGEEEAGQSSQLLEGEAPGFVQIDVSPNGETQVSYPSVTVK